MMYLKRCSKCRGDMILTGDIYGSYRQCLQCGFLVDLKAETCEALEVKHVRAA